MHCCLEDVKCALPMYFKFEPILFTQQKAGAIIHQHRYHQQHQLQHQQHHQHRLQHQQHHQHQHHQHHQQHQQVHSSEGEEQGENTQLFMRDLTTHYHMFTLEQASS